MARDYAKRPKKKATRKPLSRKRASVAPWTWLVTGLLMGLVIAAVAYLKISTFTQDSTTKPPLQAKANAKSAPHPDKNPPAPKAVAKAPPPPKFDFYTLLPEMEVAVNEPAPPKPAMAPPVAATEDPVLPHPLAQAKYRLQLASFKRYSDADTLKAKLAMTGHIVEIHSIKLDNGTVWYRVYTPIFTDREQAITLQKELQNQAINSMLLRASEG